MTTIDATLIGSPIVTHTTDVPTWGNEPHHVSGTACWGTAALTRHAPAILQRAACRRCRLLAAGRRTPVPGIAAASLPRPGDLAGSQQSGATRACDSHADQSC